MKHLSINRGHGNENTDSAGAGLFTEGTRSHGLRGTLGTNTAVNSPLLRTNLLPTAKGVKVSTATSSVIIKTEFMHHIDLFDSSDNRSHNDLNSHPMRKLQKEFIREIGGE